MQDTYRELVGFLVESQSEAANRERLSEAFAELTRNTPFTADRINRIRDDDKRRTERAKRLKRPCHSNKCHQIKRHQKQDLNVF